MKKEIPFLKFLDVEANSGPWVTFSTMKTMTSEMKVLCTLAGLAFN